MTTLERTLVDCAMTLPRRSGLVIADAALHVGADLDLCRDLVAQMKGRRGVAAARWVLDAADASAESPGESLARYEVLRADMPRPVTQLRVEIDHDVYWADLGWVEHRVFLEYDGVAKYEAKGWASAAVLAEKHRQEALERAGWTVHRIIAQDIRTPTPFLSRLHQSLSPRRAQ